MLNLLNRFSYLGLALSLLTLSSVSFAAATTNSTAPMYTGSSDQTPVSHHGLPANTNVQVLRSENGYSLVKTNNNELGWIKSSAVSRSAVKKPDPKPSKPKPVKKPAKPKPAVTRKTSSSSSNVHQSRRQNAKVEIIRSESTNSFATSETPGTIIPSASSPTTPTAAQASSDSQQEILNSIDSVLAKPQPTTTTPSTNTSTIIDDDPIYDSTPRDNQIELLSEENQHLRSELEKSKTFILQNTSSSNSPMLIEDNELLRSKVELLRAENTRLQESNTDRSFINKLLIFIFGALLGFVLNKLFSGRSSRLDW